MALNQTRNKQTKQCALYTARGNDNTVNRSVTSSTGRGTVKQRNKPHNHTNTQPQTCTRFVRRTRSQTRARKRSKMGTLPARSSHQIQTKSDPDQKSNVTQPTTAGTSCDDGKGERKRHWIQKLQTSVCLLLVLVLLIHKPGGASPALIVFLCRTLTPTRVGPEQQIQNTSTQSPSATRQVQVTKPPSYSSHTHTHTHTHTPSLTRCRPGLCTAMGRRGAVRPQRCAGSTLTQASWKTPWPAATRKTLAAQSRQRWTRSMATRPCPLAHPAAARHRPWAQRPARQSFVEGMCRPTCANTPPHSQHQTHSSKRTSPSRGAGVHHQNAVAAVAAAVAACPRADASSGCTVQQGLRPQRALP